MAERWLERVCDVEGVGTCLFYKYDQQLFQRYARNASEGVVHIYIIHIHIHTYIEGFHTGIFLGEEKIVHASGSTTCHRSSTV